MAENIYGADADSTAGTPLTQVEVSTITTTTSPAVTLEAGDTGIRVASLQNSSEIGQDSATSSNDLATVVATTSGDIVNGVRTTANPTPSTDDVLNTSSQQDYGIDYANADRGLGPSSIGTPQTVIPNPLHNYATYTYGISLHMMSPGNFTAMMSSANPLYTPSNVLVASAGRFNTTLRNAAFRDTDFYFDDLRIRTVIGSSHSNNVIDISFTLIEPNGFTFINRLLDAATNSPFVGGVNNAATDAKNYLDIPYMLQIDFFGSTDIGMPMGQILEPKHIPVTITGIKTKVSTKGAEYRITAVPYNHKSFQQTVASTPTNFQVKAATVRDFFGTGAASQATYSAAFNNGTRIDELNRELASATTDAARQDIQFQLNQATDANQVYTVKDGYANAINGWYTYLQYKRKRATVDRVSIILDPEIGNCLVTMPEQNDTRRMANTTNSAVQAARTALLNSAGVNTAGPQFTQGYYPVPAGMPIDKVIEIVIRTSTYITNQINDPITDKPETIAQKLGRPVQWFKIVPRIEIGEYDYLTGEYAKHYIYHVKKWTVSNSLPVAPMGKASGFVKKYSYMYTGKNSDVLDVSLDFDTLYYLQMTANKTENQLTTDMKRPNYLVVDNSAPEIAPTNVVAPKRKVYVPQDIRDSGQFNVTRNPKTLSGGDLHRSLTGTARGDMINVKLTIIGDPSFIKQDDVFYGQNAVRNGTIFSNPLLTPNGSIITDDGELYVLLQFRTPTDYDEVTGMYRDDRYAYSMFSGVYKILTVDNNFSRGKFTQVLDLARLMDQPAYDDLLGGQYATVYQFQRIEQQILTAALTPLQNITRNAAGRLLGSLSSIMAVASAAQQIAQNAQAIATGMLSAILGNAVSRVTEKIGTAVQGWAKEYIFTPLENWWNDITTQVGEWFDDVMFKAEMFFTGNWDSYTSEFMTCTADSFATDLTTIADRLPEGVGLDFSLMSEYSVDQLLSDLGIEAFDAVDDSVIDSLDW